MSRHYLLALILAFSLVACQAAPWNQSPEERLTVFAAASLTEVFNDLGEAYTSRNPGSDITFNYAGSQQLAQQIAQGAPADVFASANRSQMEAAISAGRVLESASTIFTTNKLVVIFPRENPAGIAQLVDLAKPGIKLVLAAREVPAGIYALQFLKNASGSTCFDEDFAERAIANVVSYEENVRSVYSKVALGEADAGIVYITDVPIGNPDGVILLEIPSELNVLAEYYISAISDNPHQNLSEAFISFVLSREGQQILARYGFSSIP